jgi:hypothetical protein
MFIVFVDIYFYRFSNISDTLRVLKAGKNYFAPIIKKKTKSQATFSQATWLRIKDSLHFVPQTVCGLSEKAWVYAMDFL